MPPDWQHPQFAHTLDNSYNAEDDTADPEASYLLDPTKVKTRNQCFSYEGALNPTEIHEPSIISPMSE